MESVDGVNVRKTAIRMSILVPIKKIQKSGARVHCSFDERIAADAYEIMKMGANTEPSSTAAELDGDKMLRRR